MMMVATTAHDPDSEGGLPGVCNATTTSSSSATNGAVAEEVNVDHHKVPQVQEEGEEDEEPSDLESISLSVSVPDLEDMTPVPPQPVKAVVPSNPNPSTENEDELIQSSEVDASGEETETHDDDADRFPEMSCDQEEELLRAEELPKSRASSVASTSTVVLSESALLAHAVTLNGPRPPPQPSDSAEVISLDLLNILVDQVETDQAEPVSSHGQPPSATNLTKKPIKSKRYCLNGTCNSRTEPSVLVVATSLQRYYYGYQKEVGGGKRKKKWICPPCGQRVEEYLKEVLTALQNQRPVFAVPTPYRAANNTVVDLDEDDEEEEGAGTEANPVKPVITNVEAQTQTQNLEPEEEEDSMLLIELSHDNSTSLEDHIDALVKDLDLKKQVELFKTWLTDQITDAEAWLARKEGEVECMEALLFELTAKLNLHRRKPYRPMYADAIDLDEEEGKQQKSSSTKKSRDALRRSKSYGHKFINSYRRHSTEETNDPDVIPLKKKKSVAARALELEPMRYRLFRPIPAPNDRMWVMKDSAFHPWKLGTIKRVRENYEGIPEYEVQFDPPDYSSKLVLARRLANPTPLRHVVPVGTRVLAPLQERGFVPSTPQAQDGGPGGGRQYFVGTVAETPATPNRFRYLIFFDDGYAEYVSQHGLLLTAESSKEVWPDVHPDTQDFIKEYIEAYPERNLVRLTRGAITTVEWNQRAYAARVLELDASLVKIQLELNKRVEWVYRGSNRFDKNLWKNLEDSADAQVHTTEAESSESESGAKKKKSSKTSTTKTSTADLGNFATANTKNLPSSTTPANILNTSNLVEYEGKLIRVALPCRTFPRAHTPHDCSPGCAPRYESSPTRPDLALYNVNPLLYPMQLGWEREVAHAKPRRRVYYRAPCGVRLRDLDEVQEYVYATKCGLGLELFSFESGVEPWMEFIPTVQKFHMDDLSYGKEPLVPIQCVNSLTEQGPDFIEYTPRRLPGKGVTINTAKEFMVCCDCEDDCTDPSKCACWQLTLEGTELTEGPGQGVPIGYQQRRLHDLVISGIYECNKYCKCRSTCVNRVVQHPLKWKLQLFKTSTKGWAIRTLQDIPTGSFICTYAAQLLHEQSANEDGRAYGDEYFAELDFIEGTERHKEGYERNVIDPETGRAVGVVKASEDAEEDGKKSVRELFGNDEQIYVMDAKTIGNIGRYMNHSCDPNVFVQNVFVDTHDLRFPWICFFAATFIRAGSELTWDYHYDVGTVQGKVMYCYCGSDKCKGRLL